MLGKKLFVQHYDSLLTVFNAWMPDAHCASTKCTSAHTFQEEDQTQYDKFWFALSEWYDFNYKEYHFPRKHIFQEVSDSQERESLIPIIHIRKLSWSYPEAIWHNQLKMCTHKVKVIMLSSFKSCMAQYATDCSLLLPPYSWSLWCLWHPIVFWYCTPWFRYSGDWSRIGVLTLDQESQLRTAAFFVVPASLSVIWKLSRTKVDDAWLTLMYESHVFADVISKYECTLRVIKRRLLL